MDKYFESNVKTLIGYTRKHYTGVISGETAKQELDLFQDIYSIQMPKVDSLRRKTKLALIGSYLWHQKRIFQSWKKWLVDTGILWEKKA